MFCVVNNNWSIRYIDINVVLQLLFDIANIDCDIDFLRDIFTLQMSLFWIIVQRILLTLLLNLYYNFILHTSLLLYYISTGYRMATWDAILSQYSFDSKHYSEFTDPADLSNFFVDVVPEYPNTCI